jgi:hypothetical protein
MAVEERQVPEQPALLVSVVVTMTVPVVMCIVIVAVVVGYGVGRVRVVMRAVSVFVVRVRARPGHRIMRVVVAIVGVIAGHRDPPSMQEAVEHTPGVAGILPTDSTARAGGPRNTIANQALPNSTSTNGANVS